MKSYKMVSKFFLAPSIELNEPDIVLQSQQNIIHGLLYKIEKLLVLQTVNGSTSNEGKYVTCDLVELIAIL